MVERTLLVCNSKCLSGVRNPGVHWKRRGHRGEEEDTEEDVSKDMDDSSAGASMEEGSMSKNSK